MRSILGLRRQQKAVPAAIFLATLLGFSLAAAPSAHADASCTVLGCSRTVDETPGPVYVARNWCGGGGNGDWTDSTPKCSSKAGSKKVPQKFKWIYSGQGTPKNQDWDTFRVDAGWCYKVEFTSFYHRYYRWYNRSHKDRVWVKVSDQYTARVQHQNYGTCS